MIDPRSYMIEQPDAVNSAFQGFGQGVQTVSYFQQQEIAKEKAIFERKQREQMQKDLSEVASNPTYEGYSRLQTLYPSIAENLSKARDTMTEGQQRQATSTAMQSTMLLGAGDVEGAKKLIESRAMAYENAGDIDTANAYRSQAKMIDANPNGAKESLMLIAANGLDPKELPKFFGDLGAERRAEQKLQPEIDKLEAETDKIEEETQWIPQLNQATIDNIDSQIDDRVVARELQSRQIDATIQKIAVDERLGLLNYQLNSDKLDADLQWRYEEVERGKTKLSDAGQTQVNNAITESTVLATQAQQQRTLADKFRADGQAGGVITSVWEKVKTTAGVETERSDMVREVTKMINSEVIRGLPPGPATDRDIDLIRKGFPPATADGKTVARFLDSVANVNMAGAANKQMQAEWLSRNGTLGTSKKDIEVMGVQVPKGSTYQSFASANMSKAIKKLDQMSSKSAVNSGSASYMKYGN